MTHLAIALLLGLVLVPVFEAHAALLVHRVEGRLVRVGVGIDSAYVDVKLSDGRKLRLRAGTATEWMTTAERRELEHLQDEFPRTAPGGRSFPSFADTHGTFRAWYLDEGNTLLWMQPLREQVPLWGVVIASLKGGESPDAFQRQVRAEEQGFPSGRLHSSEFPRLRPGFEVVLAGLFPDAEQAEACLRKARKAGYRDAYVRRIR